MKKKFICAVCGYIYEGDAAPEKCPICKAPASKFSELKDEGVPLRQSCLLATPPKRGYLDAPTLQ